MEPGKYLGICAAVLVCTGSATAVTLYVDAAGGPGTYTSIQPAIDAANDGDQIQVAPGTYTGPGSTDTKPALVDFKGKAIRLYSSGGAGVTTIDGTGYHHVVLCGSSEGPDTILEGFTITGGDATGWTLERQNGGGMCNNGSSPTVTDCVFSGNSAYWNGGGMWNHGGNPTVTDCTFRDNLAEGGGGMCNSGSSPTVTNCTFTGNGAGQGGGMYSGGGAPIVTNCIFNNNGVFHWGGGMYNGGGSAIVTNCTFMNNHATFGGCGMHNDSSVIATNCIFWSSVTTPISGVSSVVTYSVVEGGWAGEGNIDANPLFVDAAGGDYHLAPGSPCIDQGTNSPAGGLPLTDTEGNPRPVDGNGDGEAVADMGAYEAPAMAMEQLLNYVIRKVLDLALEPSVTAGLTAELNAALRVVSDGNPKNDASAVNLLNGFIKTVESQRGRKIAASDADALIAAVQQIIDLLSDG